MGAGADPIGRLEEELIQLGDASGQVGEALQVGEQQEARREWLLGRGGRGRLGGSSCTGAGAQLWVCWEVCMVCVVISYHYLTSTTLKRRWEGAWGSATLKPFQPRKKPRCEGMFSGVLSLVLMTVV